MPLVSDLPPDSLCALCDMPRWDHGDGSPTDHPFEKKPDLRPCDVCGQPEPFPAHDALAEGLYALERIETGDLSKVIEAHAYVAPPLPTVRLAEVPSQRYGTAGAAVTRDGEVFMETVEPETAQALSELLNEAVEHDRESRERVTSKVRRERVEFLQDVIENPSKTCTRYDVETAAHWAARAVMSHVDGWL